METPNEKLIRYLQDAHAAEVGIVPVLEGFIKEIDNVQVKALFQQHLTETEQQAQLLEQRLTALGSGSSTAKGFFNSLMGKASDLVQASHDTYDKTTQDLIKAYATENLEVGMYESLASYAEAIGDSTTAQLARQIQAQEQQTAQKLFPLIAPNAKAALAAAVPA